MSSQRPQDTKRAVAGVRRQGALTEQLTAAQDRGEQRTWRSGGQWRGQAAGAEMATGLRRRAAACECRGCGVPPQRTDVARLPRRSGLRALKGEKCLGDGCGHGSERHPVQTGTSPHTSLRPRTKSHVLNTMPCGSCLSACREARTVVPTLQEGRRRGEAHGLPKATEPASGSSPGLLMPQPGACAPPQGGRRGCPCLASRQAGRAVWAEEKGHCLSAQSGQDSDEAQLAVPGSYTSLPVDAQGKQPCDPAGF